MLKQSNSLSKQICGVLSCVKGTLLTLDTLFTYRSFGLLLKTFLNFKDVTSLILDLVLLWTGLYSSPATRKNPFDEGEIQVGDRVLVVGQRTGTVRFCGTTKFAPGICNTLCACLESIWNSLHVSTWTLKEFHLFPHCLQKNSNYWFVSKFVPFPVFHWMFLTSVQLPEKKMV